MQIIVTEELAARINQGIAEAQRNIDREMQYSVQFRNLRVIAECKAHIAKMHAALASGVLVAA